MRIYQGHFLLILQAFVVATAFATFLFWPPASGRMLVVSLDGASRSDMARIALAGGAALLRGGWLPGSMVVSGNRSDIGLQRGGHAILILAAPGAICGGGGRGE